MSEVKKTFERGRWCKPNNIDEYKKLCDDAQDLFDRAVNSSLTNEQIIEYGLFLENLFFFTEDDFEDEEDED